MLFTIFILLPMTSLATAYVGTIHTYNQSGVDAFDPTYSSPNGSCGEWLNPLNIFAALSPASMDGHPGETHMYD